ncbi:MAG: calcium-translocating P-type ATPase, PMCA-type [Marinilabiliaceae bacterium]|nr:calcium-translocating P-type ATPase, PMCA-type [Marinilabiliaceae bacterium]
MNETNHRLFGLTDSEVLTSRSKYGNNVLTPPKKEPWWTKLLEKFYDPLIIILLIAGTLSIGISVFEYSTGSDYKVFFEPVGIFVAIILATGLAFIFEMRADKEFAILNKVSDDEAVKVIRNGGTIQIPRRDVVVGDIVVLSTGDEVPADCELIESVVLQVDESSLTGETICSKTTNPNEFDANATYPSNHVLRGTKIMEGHALAKVLKVGDATENGKVFVQSQIDQSVKTPLNEQLERLGNLITWTSYVLALLIVIGRVVLYFINNTEQDFDWIAFTGYLLQTIMIVVALIVVAVPEGLPMAVTLSLAYSMKRMLRTNNLVRKMHACETMGAATVICTDKTGTLTQNRMNVADTCFFTNDINLIYEGIAVNSTASLDCSGKEIKVVGNPTEGALLLWLSKCNIDYTQLKSQSVRTSELPFSTERKYMATQIHSAINNRDVLYVKGAPEIVLGLCKTIEGNTQREAIEKQLLRYQRQGMRTLGFAYQIIPSGENLINSNGIKADELIFAGIVAIADPIREDVPPAVEECRQAGIKIKIVTGDTSETAREIARQIKLWDDKTDDDRNIITGPEFAALSDEELKSKINNFKVISRARPMDKKRLVETLQQLGEVVAVTGDGTNDAPALKSAHVGLSMGDGTSVAKEASDITIIDNSFQSIGKAVMWGRSLYLNIQRFILFQMTVNVAACLTVLAGAFMGTQSPLTVTQMLWVNLIMDTFAAMALASLPPDSNVMNKKPRDRKSFIISREMAFNIIIVGGFFFILMSGLWYTMHHFEIANAQDLFTLSWKPCDKSSRILSPSECSLFFSLFVMLQFWNMFNARAFMTHKSAFRFKDCNGFIFIASIILIGQILIVNNGGDFFQVEAINFMDWIWIIIGTSPILLIGELVRGLKK